MKTSDMLPPVYGGPQIGQDEMEKLDDEMRADIISTGARVTYWCRSGLASDSHDWIMDKHYSNEELLALNGLLDSKVRSALKAEQERRKAAKAGLPVKGQGDEQNRSAGILP